MYPILFSIFKYPVASQGVFLTAAVLGGLFIIWRIIRSYELNEEQILDILFWVTIFGLVGARAYFIIFHRDLFSGLDKILNVFKYPGLSFWGGFFGGLVALKFLASKFRVDFWQIADFIFVGLFFGIFISSFGCIFGSCQYGQVSSIFFAIDQVGLVGKRFPLQVFESLVFLVLFIKLWYLTLRFHFTGEVIALGLIYLGLTKFIFEFFRGDQILIFGVPSGIIFGSFSFILGVKFYYTQSKRIFMKDLLFLGEFFYKSSSRKMLIQKTKRSWYNFKVNFKIGFHKFRISLFKLLNIRSNPEKFYK